MDTPLAPQCNGRRRLVFFDIDGVLHPFADRYTRPYSNLPAVEQALRTIASAEVVITSNRREDMTLAELQAIFSPDIGLRITGITPALPVNSAADLAGSRYREILQYLADHPAERWVALDDDASLFPPDCPHLILCSSDSGFDSRAARQLEALFD